MVRGKAAQNAAQLVRLKPLSTPSWRPWSRRGGRCQKPLRPASWRWFVRPDDGRTLPSKCTLDGKRRAAFGGKDPRARRAAGERSQYSQKVLPSRSCQAPPGGTGTRLVRVCFSVMHQRDFPIVSRAPTPRPTNCLTTEPGTGTSARGRPSPTWASGNRSKTARRAAL